MTKHVLVADDDPSIVRALTRQLETLGCTVTTGTNFHEVSGLLDEVKYDLIISDNSMPLAGIGRPHPNCGLQLLARARMMGPNGDTPFVLHTGDELEKTKRHVARYKGHYQLKGDNLDDLLKELLST